MKKALLFPLLTLAFGSHAQTVLFSDDFEAGTSNWLLSGTWGTTTTQSHSPSASLTDSPAGNYAPNSTSYAIMVSGVDLTTAISADVSFWAIYDIELGFDYMYVEVSTNGGGSWQKIATFNGEGLLSPWTQYSFSLGGFVGSSDVRVRFRYVTDQGYEVDGMYIDDFQITSSSIDNADPLINHAIPEFYQGALGNYYAEAEIIDISGLSQTQLSYSVDGGTAHTVNGVHTYGNHYLFTIPAQSPGAWVSYTITATDASPAQNSATTDTAKYIAGNYIAYDNAVVDNITGIGPGSGSGVTGVAVRITLNGSTGIVAGLIRNYTDINNANDPMQVHIWSNNGGFPGTDLITPITMNPEASLSAPQIMTRIDLRAYTAQLSGLTGDVFIGYTVPSGQTFLTQTATSIANRSVVTDGVSWAAAAVDFHFRVITTALAGAPTAAFAVNNSSTPSIVFTDQSTGSPSGWTWSFGEGGTSPQQNPVYNFAQNGDFNVCLTASNAIGASTACQLVSIDVYPTADFNYDASASPTVNFLDASTNNPTGWDWDFDDAGSGSTQQNPSHTFSGPGAYSVCLTATNAAGQGQPSCQTVIIWSVGVEESKTHALRVFPNPASDVVYLELAAHATALEAITIDGSVVKLSYDVAHDVATVRLDPLPQGVYMIRALHGGVVVGSARVVRM